MPRVIQNPMEPELTETTPTNMDSAFRELPADEESHSSDAEPLTSAETEPDTAETSSVPDAEKPPAKRTRKAGTKKTPSPDPDEEKPPTPLKASFSSILTLQADTEVETQESREDLIWHELQNAYRTKKILTGRLGGIEKLDGGGTIAVVYYKEMRVVIPLTEMMINLVQDEAHDYGELVQRQNKIVGNMLGCEIDFLIKGLDNSSRSIVASRKDAMYKKRQIFYLPDASGISRVREDRIVQARVIAHSCYDNRLPGKKDEVSFVVTRIDEERNVAVGLISRIIKQNI